MADNVAITAGSGVTVGADEVTIGGNSQKLQRIKVFDATDASTNALVVTTRGAAKVELSGITSQLSVSARGAALVEGHLAHDAAVTGNPVRIGARARSSLSGYTSVTTNDLTEIHADVDGVLLGGRMIPLGSLLTTRVSPTTAAAAGFTQLAATTLLRNYVTSINVYNSGATAVFVSFLNGTTGSAGFYTVGANAKANEYVHFNPPLRQASTNTAFGYKLSAAIGGSGVIISVTGFQSKL